MQNLFCYGSLLLDNSDLQIWLRVRLRYIEYEYDFLISTNYVPRTGASFLLLTSRERDPRNKIGVTRLLSNVYVMRSMRDVTIAVESQFKQLRNSPKKSFSQGPQQDSNPWPLRSRCSVLPAELWRPIHWEQADLLSSSTRERGDWTQNEMMWTAEIQMKSTAMVIFSFHLYSQNSHHFILCI